MKDRIASPFRWTRLSRFLLKFPFFTLDLTKCDNDLFIQDGSEWWVNNVSILLTDGANDDLTNVKKFSSALLVLETPDKV